MRDVAVRKVLVPPGFDPQRAEAECRDEITTFGGDDEDVTACVQNKEAAYSAQAGPHDYTHRFTVGGQPYQVNLTKIELLDSPDFERWLGTVGLRDSNALLTLLHPTYSVSLDGPAGYERTGRNTGMTAVYQELLAAMSDLLRTEDVRALHYAPHEPAMNLVYDRFVRTFLRGRFVPLGPGVLLRRDVMAQFVRLADPRKLGPSVRQNNALARQNLEQVRKTKERERWLRSMTGRLVLWNGAEPNPAVLKGVSGNQAWLAVVDMQTGRVRNEYVPSRELEPLAVGADQQARIRRILMTASGGSGGSPDSAAVGAGA